ncbi:hypothetical protein ACFFWA_32210 [Actinomadura verrucosospora]|uniref:hypothetical protein n=1 Tax=Actinomadura TaxID=1988 RepID=UPI0031E84465
MRQGALQPLLGAGRLPGAVGDRHVPDGAGSPRRSRPSGGLAGVPSVTVIGATS